MLDYSSLLSPKLEIPCSLSLCVAATSPCSAKFIPIDLYHAMDSWLSDSLLYTPFTFLLADWQAGTYTLKKYQQ